MAAGGGEDTATNKVVERLRLMSRMLNMGKMLTRLVNVNNQEATRLQKSRLGMRVRRSVLEESRRNTCPRQECSRGGGDADSKSQRQSKR